jgi:protein-disulfide isomerase
MRVAHITLCSALTLWSCQNQPLPSDDTEARAEAVAADCACRAKDRAAPAAVDDIETVDLSSIDLSRAPSRGPSSAAVTLVAFCDFECPFCRRVQPTLAELERRYGPDLRIVFKQLPLAIHENAKLAAIATFAADEQGSFWQLHDALFDTRTQPDRMELERLADDVGLDVERFRSALDSAELAERVEQDVADATRLGIRGTPTFLVNGKKLAGAQPIEQFEKLIDAALESRE